MIYFSLFSKIVNMETKKPAIIPRTILFLDQLIVYQLIKKFLFFYGTRRFITVFRRVHHWNLS